MNLKSILDVEVLDRKVLLKVDFNVPLIYKKNQTLIEDDDRIKASLPTINNLLERGARLTIVSHLGRPDGKFVQRLSLEPVAKRVEKFLGKKVRLVNHLKYQSLKPVADKLKRGEVVLLENCRFDPGEESNSRRFARKLASAGEIFVNDAFAVSHRPHASVVGVAKILPTVAGFGLLKEIELISRVLLRPKKPFVVLVGGVKFDKVSLLNKLAEISNWLIVGGAMANGFLQASGKNVGLSLVDKKVTEEIKNIIKKYGQKIILPVDLMVKNEKTGRIRLCRSDELTSKDNALDVGRESLKKYKEIIRGAKTVLWNGPFGMFEVKPFDRSSKEIVKMMAESQAITIIGGAETLAAIDRMDEQKQMTYISVGGGAMIEFLEKGTLPGIRVIDKRS
jgi:phosphoglycerate kinase